MATGAATFLRCVGDVAKRSVNALNAVHQAGLFEVLQRAEYGHSIQPKEQVDQFTVREGAPSGEKRGQDTLPGRSRSQARLFEHVGWFQTADHAYL